MATLNREDEYDGGAELRAAEHRTNRDSQREAAHATVLHHEHQLAEIRRLDLQVAELKQLVASKDRDLDALRRELEQTRREADRFARQLNEQKSAVAS